MLLCKQITWSPLSAEWMSVAFIRLPLFKLLMVGILSIGGFSRISGKGFFVSIVSGYFRLRRVSGHGRADPPQRIGESIDREEEELPG
jgi:hypothetical protein